MPENEVNALSIIDQAIAAQEALRGCGILPDEQIDATLAALRAQRVVLLAQVMGTGNVVAQNGAAAANHGGVAIAGSVYGGVHLDRSQAGPDAASLRQAYLQRLWEQSSYLSLAGVDRKAASEAEARLSLWAVYTALMTTSPEAQERLSREGRAQEAEYLSALQQLDAQARLVLLGDPGSGKSTFVNFVATCLAGEALGLAEANLAALTAPLPDKEGKDEEKRQPWQHGALLPVRVVLRDLAARGLPPPGKRATCRHLWDYIVADLESASLGDYAPHLYGELMEQGGLLLLDGLDEVPEAAMRRAQIKEMVQDFCATFRRCHILITSRTYAYQRQEWRLPGFAEAVLAPFTEGQIRRFIDRWYAHIAILRHLSGEDAQGRAELLKRAVLGSERLQGLAQRPLLLTLMASLHAWRGGSLPEKRELLYADTLELLLDWWESPKIVRDAQANVVMSQPSLAEWLCVDRSEVRALLEELAYRAHAAQPGTTGTADVSEGDLVTRLMRLSQNPEANPVRLLQYLSQRAGLLLPRGEGVYTFPHRTFQEYLAACYLTDHDYPEQVADLARRDPGRWREVALLAGAKAARGTASAIWSLADALCYRDAESTPDSAEDLWGAHLAGQALVETADLRQVGERHRPKVERIGRWLLGAMRTDSLTALERAMAGRSLARLGDPREEVLTVPGMQFCYVPPGPFWMGSSDDDMQADDDEKPLRCLDLPCGYWMARYPATDAQYAAFVQAGGYREARYWPEARQAQRWLHGRVRDGRSDTWREAPNNYGELYTLPNHPVVGVMWYEALAYVRWLDDLWRGQGLLPEGWTVRLPSEAEWEKAARGGVQVPQEPLIRAARERLAGPGMDLEANPLPRRRYPWGDQADPERANGDESRIGSTSGVGCFPGGASRYGAEELSGNVWEWTRSLWGKDWQTPDFGYPYDPGDDRENPGAEDDVRRVVRGGSFNTYDEFVRCAYRDGYFPFNRFVNCGFRVVVVPISL